MTRRIVVLLGLALAVVASGCVAYGHPDAHRYGGRYSGSRSYAWPARTVVVERPVYVHRQVHRRYEPRREWVREHRHHRHPRYDRRDRDRRDWRDWRRRR